MMRYSVTVLFLLFALLLGSCAGAEPLRSGEHPPVRLTVWQTYWDREDGAAEYAALRRQVEAVSLFAVCYDENDALLVPDEVRTMLAAQKKGKAETYLSFTNDVLGKKRVEKDRELLRRILHDDAAIDRNVDAIVRMTHELGADGVELDYENFAKEKPLLDRYMIFTYRLIVACVQQHLKLRIVLEPSMPFDAGFAPGAEYVVMLYNLYGKHSGPGAKAERAFIEKTIERMHALPGSPSVAFATGGCLWQDHHVIFGGGGEKRFITQREAEELAARAHAEPVRDEESAALHFTADIDGHKAEVWYADSETLNAWITCAANQGIEQVSIWRMGGNHEIGKVRSR